MTKKCVIDEIFNKSPHTNGYEWDIDCRNFKRIRQSSFTEFLTQSNNFQIIPTGKTGKSNRILFEKIVV
ncbi:MAG: DUF504 domain-containing protein [Candidatus Nitrosopumilus sp. bin_68KS]